jgi:hypothetical protein
MSNEEADKAAEKETEIQSHLAALPDWYMQRLVNLVNGTEIEFPITLFVSGAMVSGQLVSGHRYFGEGLASALKQFFGKAGDEAKTAIEHLTSAKEIYLKEQKEQKDENADDKVKRPPQYIHLREARVFTAGQEPIPTEGAWWRGRLSSVDAFHFGSLQFKKN